MSVIIEEGKVGDLINKGIKGFQNTVKTVKDYHDYLTGKRFSPRDYTEKASDSDLEKTPFKPFIDNFASKGFKYTAKKDKNGKEVAITFNVSNVPKRLAYLCTNENAKGSFKPYVKDYKDGKATLVFPLNSDTSKKNSLSDRKSKEKSSPEVKKDKNGTTDNTGNESMMTPVQVKKRGYKCDKNGHIIIDEEGNREVVKEDYHSRYQEVGHKSVQDSDGFWTDYTMYHNLDDDTYVMIFGDNEIYSPYNTEPDFECDTREEADEWFDSYEGFVDDEEEYSVDEPDWYSDEDSDMDFDSYDGPTVYDENPEYNEWDESLDEEHWLFDPFDDPDEDTEDDSEDDSEENNGLTLKNEDYWFGGDGKIDNEHRPDKAFGTKDSPDDSEDEEDTEDDQSSTEDDSAESAFDDSSDEELPESIMNETPGLTLSTPEVNSQDYSFDDPEEYQSSEEGLTLKDEDYWFGGNGKTSSDSPATEKPFTDTPDDVHLDLDTDDEIWKDEEVESVKVFEDRHHRPDRFDETIKSIINCCRQNRDYYNETIEVDNSSEWQLHSDSTEFIIGYTDTREFTGWGNRQDFVVIGLKYNTTVNDYYTEIVSFGHSPRGYDSIKYDNAQSLIEGFKSSPKNLRIFYDSSKKFLSQFSQDSKDIEEESVMNETPGLTLSTPEVNSQGILEIEINGKKYRYTCDNPDTSSKEVADKVTKMKKYSDGKALAYLKKNMKLVTESSGKDMRQRQFNYYMKEFDASDLPDDDSSDMEKYLDYHFGWDRDRDISHYTEQDKLRAMAYWFANNDPVPEYYLEESLVVSEKLDGSVKDDIRTDVINAFYKAAKDNDRFGFPSDEEIDEYYSPVFVVEDFNNNQIRVEVRFEADYETMGLMAEELNPVVKKYDKNSYFDFVDVGIMEAFIEADITEGFEFDPDEDNSQEIEDVLREVNRMYGDLNSEDAVDEVEAILKDKGIYLDADELGRLISQFNKISIRRDECTESIDESLQGQDGWSDDIVGLFDEYLQKADDLSYELRMTVRGAMTGARTVSELAEYVDNLGYMLTEISSELESSEQELTESNPFKSHHICKGCGKPLDKCTCGVQEEDVDLNSLEEDYEVQRNKTITVDLEDSDASFERLIKYIKSVADSGRFFSVVVDPDEEDLKKEFYINGEDGFDINKIKTEDSVEDVEIKESLSLKEDLDLSVGQELTSKSGHKIKINSVKVGMSEYDGSPYVRIGYDYEMTDGKKGSSTCDSVSLFKMLQEDNFEECTQPSSIGQHKVSEIVDPDNKEDEEVVK